MNTNLPLTLGISSCPNDTYIFDALVHGRIPMPFSFTTHMADVEELNLRTRQPHSLDVTKLSLAAAAHILDKYILLNAGAALGRGCGPLLVANRPLSEAELAHASIAIPGLFTTANTLLSLTGKFQGKRHDMLFDKVMPAVQTGQTDLGLIIHEGRFTYAKQGLHLVLDLGQWWEERTGLPLPLGIIAVKRSLGEEVASLIDDAIRRSIQHATHHPEDGRPYIRQHAQEMDETVMQQHIATFVNDFSTHLGVEGQKAVTELLHSGAALANITLPDVPFFISERRT